jgi:hypothetical protein
MAKHYRELIPNADVVELEGIGHYPQVQAPKAVLGAYFEFRSVAIEARKVIYAAERGMVCVQVIGEDNAVAFAGIQGNFELDAMRPIIINTFSSLRPDPRRRLRQVPPVFGGRNRA